MTIGLIWAQAHDRVIGADNAIPWHISADLQRFRRITSGHRVVMGRRTWESLPPKFRPLPGRENVVLSRDPSWNADGATVQPDLAAALEATEDTWVIGGGEIYRQALEVADVLEVTEVDLAVDGDALAPIVGADWRLTSSDPLDGWHTDEKSGLRYRWLTYHR